MLSLQTRVRDEGNGWVDWSGLATLLGCFDQRLAATVELFVHTCPTQRRGEVSWVIPW